MFSANAPRPAAPRGAARETKALHESGGGGTESPLSLLGHHLEQQIGN